LNTKSLKSDDQHLVRNLVQLLFCSMHLLLEILW